MWEKNHIYLGTAYYPEHWPKSRWAVDANLMREAGIEVVRIAELAWASLQPDPETFNFTWVDEFLDVAERYGLLIILGTPTEAPPPWLWRRHPEVVAADEWRRPHGGRGRYCYNNRRLQSHIGELVGVMAQRYGRDARVVGWQIDNEVRGTPCYCDQCRTDFVAWLRARYGSLEALNEAWGTVFWSQRYGTWEEVDVPAGDHLTRSTSQILDHLRFASESAVRHIERQAAIIRRYSPEQFITHNSMGLYPWVDLHELGRTLDFMGWDSYPSVDSDNFDTVMAHDLIRQTKPGRPFWMLEQKNGYFNGGSYNLAIEPGLVRLWAYQDLARGANGVVFYRWRSNRFNVEQNPNGILRHDGSPRRAYYEVQRLARELSGFGSRLAATQVEASIAILWSYDQIWAQKARLQYPALRYDAEVAAYHRAVTELGWTADLVAPTADLSRYALVIAPMLTLVRDDILANLAEYVRTGGQLVLTCQSGVKSWSNVVFDVTWPEPLAEMLGMTVREFDAPPPGETNGVWYGGRRYTVDGWLEVLEPQGAEVLGQYDAKFYAGSAAVTRNRFDRGTVTYVGVRHQPELARVLVADAMGEPDRPMLPRGVFCTTRQGEGGRFTFYVNMQPTEAEVTVYRPGRDVIAGHAVTPGRIRLGSWDVAVIEED